TANNTAGNAAMASLLGGGAVRWIGLEPSLRPTGPIKAVVWQARGPLGGTTTEAIGGAQIATRMRNKTNGERDFPWSDDGSASDNGRSPQLARRGYPLYPRIANAVQVWQTDTAPGTWLTANADGLYPGRLR